MRAPKTAYQLRESQVSTPPAVVSLFWKLLKERRPQIKGVLDMGAGDARFASGGHYKRYDGVELDPQRSKLAQLPKNGRMFKTCAFRLKNNNYDACIGNPPYVRHHDIEKPWRKRTAAKIKKALGIDLNGNGNLYLYFLCLGLIKTRPNGIVAVVVPFEWVSRPSAQPIRDYIEKNGWNVSVYRFREAIFDGVLTTASITIVDKNSQESSWKYYDIAKDLSITPRVSLSGGAVSILRHSLRGDVWARRGISPGGQKVFALTDKERIKAGLWLSDVVPCVTSLRSLPQEIAELNHASFKKHFVRAGHRCWLVKSTGKRLSERVISYLSKVPKSERDAYACRTREPWYRYETPPTPALLFHSGFVKRGPKVLVNAVDAQAVGSMYGVHMDREVSKRLLRQHLSRYNFERRIVAHARTLRKVEVAQLNSVLSDWLKSQNR